MVGAVLLNGGSKGDFALQFSDEMTLMTRYLDRR